MDHLQRAADQRLALWRLHDDAGRLDGRVSEATRNAPAGTSSSAVAGDDPEALLTEGRRALDDALDAEREVAAQQDVIARAEAAIAAIEDEQARRRQQLIVAAIVVVAVLLVLLALTFSG